MTNNLISRIGIQVNDNYKILNKIYNKIITDVIVSDSVKNSNENNYKTEIFVYKDGKMNTLTITSDEEVVQYVYTSSRLYLRYGPHKYKDGQTDKISYPVSYVDFKSMSNNPFTFDKINIGSTDYEVGETEFIIAYDDTYLLYKYTLIGDSTIRYGVYGSS